MCHFNWSTALLVLVPAVLLSGCANHVSRHAFTSQTGESVVLAGEAPASLAFVPSQSRPVIVRSTYRDGLPQTIHYKVGRDYLLEAPGQIRRTFGSCIPDFGTNILYGKEDFRHDQFPGFGNGPFFIYMDYAHREEWELSPAKAEFSAARLPTTRRKGADRGVWGQYHRRRGRLRAGLDFLGALGERTAREVSTRQC